MLASNRHSAGDVNGSKRNSRRSKYWRAAVISASGSLLRRLRPDHLAHDLP
jgi:hypothetical protein